MRKFIYSSACFFLLGMVLPFFAASQDPLKIGDRFGGGIVVYLDEKGEHGLIAAATDQASNAPWYTAYEICQNYSVTEDGKVYKDWRLPSIEELRILFNQKGVLPGIEIYGTYHSGSNGGPGYGYGYWTKNFARGTEHCASGESFRARAVRSF